MSDAKQKNKLPPEVVKRSERLRKSRKKKDNVSHDSQARSKATALDDPECGTSKETKSAGEVLDGDNPESCTETKRPDGAFSPEPNCSICLCKLENKSFTDSCFHIFCFTCLMEWSKIKAVCPLCKQNFKSIIYNVRSYEDYDQYHVEKQQNSPGWENPGGSRFRYRTTVTQEHIVSFERYDDILRRPSAIGAMQRPTPVTTRQNWRRQRQIATTEFRSQIYTNGLKVKEIRDTNGRLRYVNPAFYASNPAATHRLVPWLKRELKAILFDQKERIKYLIEIITALIKRFGIQSEEFYQHVNPYIGRYTRHFMEEFQMFAQSPYLMPVYDTKVTYEEKPQSVSDSDSDVSYGGNDSDVMIISPKTSVGQRPRQNVEPRAERSWFQLDVSPRTVSLRDLLEDNSFSTSVRSGTGQSGWESPTPGPSWDISLTGAITNQIDVSTTETNESYKISNKRSNGVKREEKTERHVIDSDCSSSSDVVFLRFEQPWQERSPLMISSDEQSKNNNMSPEIQSEKVLLKEKSPSRSRRDSYSSIERCSSRSSSHSRKKQFKVSAHHQRRATRSSSEDRKRSRSHSHGSYKHKKFSRSQRRKRHRSRSSSDDDWDNWYVRRSDSTLSKSSRHTKRKNDRNDCGHMSGSKYRCSENATRPTKYSSRSEQHEKHQRRKKYKKHRRDGKKEKRKRSRDESVPPVVSSNSSKDGPHEKRTLKSYVLSVNGANNWTNPSPKIQYSDVSDDSMSSSKSSQFKKHTSGHKKSKKYELNNPSTGEASSSTRNYYTLAKYHSQSSHSDTDSLPQKKHELTIADSHSDTDSLPQKKHQLTIADESSTQESMEEEVEEINKDLLRTESMPAVALEVGSSSLPESMPAVALEVGSSSLPESMPAVALEVGSSSLPESTPAVDLEVGFSSLPNTSLLADTPCSATVSSNDGEKDITNEDSSEEHIIMTGTSSNKKPEEIPGFSSLDFVSDSGIILNDEGLMLEQFSQNFGTVSVPAEALTIDSSSNDSTCCSVSSSGVYTQGPTVDTTVSMTIFQLLKQDQQNHKTVSYQVKSPTPIKDITAETSEKLELESPTPITAETSEKLELESPTPITAETSEKLELKSPTPITAETSEKLQLKSPTPITAETSEKLELESPITDITAETSEKLELKSPTPITAETSEKLELKSPTPITAETSEKLELESPTTDHQRH